MPVFPSVAWAHAFKDAVNARPAFQEKAKGLTAEFVFHLTPEDGLTSDHFMHVRLDGGRCVSVEERDSAGDAGDGRFILRGPYGEWKRLLQGELDPVQAILTRRLEVKGSVSALMRYVGAAKELGAATGDVPTEYL
jgi:putative sterol carrier protein